MAEYQRAHAALRANDQLVEATRPPRVGLYRRDSVTYRQHHDLLPPASSNRDASFDHLVGAADQRQRNGKAECLGSLQVDD